MNEIINKAMLISEKQNIAKKEIVEKDMQFQERMREEQIIGTERAKQFVQLMQENNISPTDKIYHMESRTVTIFNPAKYTYELIGLGWSIQEYAYGHGDEDTPGLIILEDSSVSAWKGDEAYKWGKSSGRRIQQGWNCSHYLCGDHMLDILGTKVVELGIIK